MLGLAMISMGEDLGAPMSLFSKLKFWQRLGPSHVLL